MLEKRNIFGLNVWGLLISFVVVYLLFFSERGQERVKTWINLLEFSDKRISDSIVSQTNLEKEFEKTISEARDFIREKRELVEEAEQQITGVK